MSDFITLTCPSCGGKLNITSDISRFACTNCGNEHLIKRGGGIVSLVPLTIELRKVQAGVDKTASELAIKRLKEEILDIEIEIDDLLDEIDEVHPKDYLLDEEDTDIIVIELNRDIIKMQQSSKSLIGMLSGMEAKLKDLTNLTDELKNLQVSLKDKKSQLQNHEQIVNE